MQVRILGCSGGIGAGLKTTSLMLDEAVLIDAGTGVENLTLPEMARIQRVFVTHAHLDHVACLPLMLASVYGRCQAPLEVYAGPECLQALREHLFNWSIWPDYTQLPTAEQPSLLLQELAPGQHLALADCTVEAIAVNHPSPTQGYLVTTRSGAFAFSGDTSSCPDFWRRLGRVKDLRHVLVDVSFPDQEQAVADASGHYTPRRLAEDLAGLMPPAQLHISHLKPGYEAEIIAQCRQALPGWHIRALRAGDRLALA